MTLSVRVKQLDVMKSDNLQFINIVKQIIILALNASIEAARTGEVKKLASHSEQLNNSYKESLDKNSLITIFTFQNIKASCYRCRYNTTS